MIVRNYYYLTNYCN